MGRVAIFVDASFDILIAVKAIFWQCSVSAFTENLTGHSDPDGRYFLRWFLDRFVDVVNVTIFINIGSDIFITIESVF